ncbi:class I SAM-dependent methyltransferase, partial [bacterium]|nr:class I SAM-dependent methyltransferase [bacterium]
MNKLIKQLKVACLLALALVTSSALAKLNPKNRPDNLQFSINDNFESLGKFSRWNFDGQSSYSIMQINTTDLAKTIIKTAPKNQKIFYILDLGAGHFQWGNTLFEKLNELADKGELPSDITVNIVSVVGEKYVTEIEEAGICKKYNIANFKVEDLDLSLGRFLYKQDPDNFEENPQFDLIVSQYCFIHLNDPVGTFAQAYNLLRPKSGLMLMQYFAVIDDNVSADDLYRIEGNRAIIDFLLNTKAPFLIGAWGDNRLPYEFLLRRPDDASLNLPMEYASTLDLKLANTVSHPIATFKKLKGYRTFRTQEINLPVSGYWDTKPGDSFYGDVSLFQWLIKNYPGWKKTIVRWEPILKSD